MVPYLSRELSGYYVWYIPILPPIRACYDRRRRRPPDVGRTNYRPTAPTVPT